MGKKAGRAGNQPGARWGRDQIPRSAPSCLPSEPPSPSMRQLHQQGKHVSFSWWPALTRSLLTPASCPLPSNETPAGLCARGFISVTPPLRPGSPARQGTAWVRKDLRKLTKWVGDGLALFPHTVSQSPTGSRRRVADVREDKGRRGPHQPPVIDGLCPDG